MPPQSHSKYCPYLDKDCPKIEEVNEEVNELKKSLAQIQFYVYVLIGMVAVNWGFTLW